MGLHHKLTDTVKANRLLTVADYGDTEGHRLVSQQVGDLMYIDDERGGPVRLAIGSANQVLQTNSSATAPEWASTLSSLTLTSPVLTTPEINDTSADHQYVFAVSELTADRTVTLPLLDGNATFSFIDFAETFSAEKTFSADAIMSSAAIRWSSGVAVVAGEYSAQRDADGTNQMHWNVPTGASFEWSINDVPAWKITSGGELQSSGSGFDIDLSSGGRVLNVGAAGNDWEATKLTHKGSGDTSFTRTTGNTSGELNPVDLIAESSGNMSDGFASILGFQIADDTQSKQFIGYLGFERNGADNTGRFLVTVYAAGSANEGLLLTETGVLSVDLAGTGTAAQVDLFDEYDDAVELQRYAYTMSPTISEEQRNANRQRMLEMGVISRKDTGCGYMIDVQPLTRLLAGGIYQNRWAIDTIRDEQEVRFSTVEDRVGALEEAQDILRAQVVALGATPEA